MMVGATSSITGTFRTIGAFTVEVRHRLTQAGVESAEQEAVWLVEHALGLSGLRQIVDRSRLLTDSEVAAIEQLVVRRVRREPLQYILGTQEFCGLEFEVNPSVLIPRPETELLVHETIRRLLSVKSPTIVDVGTGSGCLAVSLVRSLTACRMLAVDCSAAALTTAKRNARRHGVEQAINWLEGDLLAPLNGLQLQGVVAAIISNPPYVREADWATLQPEVARYEPRTALVAGLNGTEYHQRLLDEGISFLRPGGVLLMELGQGQSESLRKKVSSMPAYKSPSVLKDDAGIDRVFIVERRG